MILFIVWFYPRWFGLDSPSFCRWGKRNRYVQAKGTSIGDLETQLEFLCKQLSESYASTVWNVCKTATSVIQASNAMLLKFERPADQSLAVQTKRASYGQTYYDKYAKSSTSSTPTISGNPSNTGGTTTMSVMIGHASIDENGRITGGAAGDQSGTEVCKRTWYNKHSSTSLSI